MKISELISNLNSILEQHGDFPVSIRIMASDGVIWIGDFKSSYLRSDKHPIPTNIVIDATRYDRLISVRADRSRDINLKNYPILKFT